jgi:hypothetical protein
MDSFAEKLQDKDFRDNILNYALKNNPNMKDFSDFKQALLEEFEGSRPASVSTIGKEDTLKGLFETDTIRERIRRNVGEEEYQRIYEEEKESNVEYFEPEKGKAGTTNIIIYPKEYKVQGYTTKTGEVRDGYSRSRKSWLPVEKTFISERKRAGYKPKSIITEYRNLFSGSDRSEASLRMKIFKTKI